MNSELLMRFLASQADSMAVAGFTVQTMLLARLLEKKILSVDEYFALYESSARSLRQLEGGAQSETDRVVALQAAEMLENFARMIREGAAKQNPQLSGDSQ